jgi:hypothetical protein
MLLSRGGERVLETCIGYADRPGERIPVTPATRFGIASVTKMFTACTVASLVRDALVAFETPVGEGYGVHLYPDGRYGHDGGDPGVEALAYRWPEEDVHLVVLINTEVGLVLDVRDAMIAAWRG